VSAAPVGLPPEVRDLLTAIREVLVIPREAFPDRQGWLEARSDWAGLVAAAARALTEAPLYPAPEPHYTAMAQWLREHAPRIELPGGRS
jgi:hypothetical protein